MSEHEHGIPGVVRTSLWILGIFVAIMIGLAVYSQLTNHTSLQTASIHGVGHSVLVASTPSARYQGLSGKTVENLGAEGMYFSFKDTAERTFAMRGMLFSLDFIWVRDGKVVKIQEHVSAPAGNESPELVYSKPETANGVFEFPAGFVSKNAVRVGDNVEVR